MPHVANASNRRARTHVHMLNFENVMRVCHHVLVAAPYFDGKVSEWNLHGVSTNVKHADVSADGVEPVILHLSYHLSRKASAIVVCCICPLIAH